MFQTPQTLFPRIGITVVLVLAVIFLAFPAEAQPQLQNIPGVSYNVNASLADNLKAFVGKKVYVTLDSGKVFTGQVKAVGAQLVHVQELEGKEYFDALIPIQHIAAIDTRFRQLKR